MGLVVFRPFLNLFAFASVHPRVPAAAGGRSLLVKAPHTPDPRSAESHVDLVGVLFMVWGGLTILIGASTLALGMAAASLISAAAEAGRGQFAASLTAATFTIFALIAMIWGAVHVAIGLLARRRRHWSRLAAILLGSVDLLLLPYGTALGVYALWVLLREDSKRLFDETPIANR